MKKLYILLAIFYSSFIVNAQDWAPVGTEWYYGHSYAFSGDIDFNFWASVGDTVINGQDCRIIQKSLGNCALRQLRDFMYGEDRRIYFFNDSTQNFEVLYDFNLEAGESYSVPMWFNQETWINTADSVTVNIDSTSTFIWNDSTYKVQFCSYFSPGIDGGIFQAIENIGGTSKMFNFIPGFCDFAFDSGLRCYNSTETDLITFGTLACDFTNPIEELDKPVDILLYPNPVSGFLSIDYDSGGLENLEFKLINLSGQQILSGKLQNRQDQIDFTQLYKGIYFIQVLQDGVPIQIEKVVKM